MRLVPLLLAIGMLLVPSCATVQQDDAISEEPVPLEIDVARAFDLQTLDLDEARALELEELQELAEQGDAAAQDELSSRYAVGDGVPQDSAESNRLIRQAAAQGYVFAQFMLGLRYRAGASIPQDEGEAHRWLLLAAKQGHVLSQFYVALDYRQGTGVPEDFVRAHMWSNLAAAQRDEASREMREEIEIIMTPQQIAQAQEMATRCFDSNYSDCD